MNQRLSTLFPTRRSEATSYAAGFAVLSLLALLTTTSADPGFTDSLDSGIRAMTYNLYLGADLFRLLSAATPPGDDTDPCIAALGFPAGIPCLTGDMFRQFVAADFTSRAEVIADFIKDAKPTVVGLQEVTTALTGPFNTDVLETGPTASEVHTNYMSILLSKLKERGLNYNGSVGPLVADNESPSFYPDPFDPTKGMINIRIQTRNAMLINTDVASLVGWGELPFETQEDFGSAAMFDYGAISADVTTDVGETYHVVNAHLSVSSSGVQAAQADEVLDWIAKRDGPLILLGDFNSYEGQVAHPSEQDTPYNIFTNKFTDAWKVNVDAEIAGPGNTFGHNATLTNDAANMTKRIDFIMYQGLSNSTKVKAKVYGADPTDSKTADGKLWASDHAGVFAHIAVPTPAVSAAFGVSAMAGAVTACIMTTLSFI